MPRLLRRPRPDLLPGVRKSRPFGHHGPPLDDEELEEVEAAYPRWRVRSRMSRWPAPSQPLPPRQGSTDLWSDDRLLPQSEREFRELFWQEIVRVDHRTAGGMPRRREEAFMQIALRRAEALTLYAACGDLDAEVVDGLPTRFPDRFFPAKRRARNPCPRRSRRLGDTPLDRTSNTRRTMDRSGTCPRRLESILPCAGRIASG